MSRNRAAPSLVGETDRHRVRRPEGQRGAERGRTVGRAWGSLTWSQVRAVVQVGTCGLLHLLRGSVQGQE